MAIARIDKIEIIGLEADKENVLSILQKEGAVQFISAETQSGASPAAKSEADMLALEEAISFLSTLEKRKGALEGIVPSGQVIYQDKLEQIIASFDYRAVVGKLTTLRNHLKNHLIHKEKLNEEKRLLEPWKKLTLPLGEIHPTAACGATLGIADKRDYANIIEECNHASLNIFIEIAGEDRSSVYVACIYLKEEFEKLDAIFKKHRFNFVTLSHHRHNVKERLVEIKTEEMLFDDHMEDIKQEMAGILPEKPRLMAAYDYLGAKRGVAQADKNLSKQRYTFYMQGWARHRDIGLITKRLSGSFRDIILFVSKPSPGEEVPVDLDNNKLIQPFEFITKIYGMPKYGELDPTPFLAPFFFLYFGFCVSDVGYGLMLAGISYFVLKKFRMGPQGLRFFRLFFLCGLSTIIIGALTGSWFGNLFDMLAAADKMFMPLKRFKDSLVVLDPLREPTKLLAIALSFGVIQVWFGNIVAAIGNIKNKRYMDILFDQVTMLTFLFGLTGLALIFLKIMDGRLGRIFAYSAQAGALGLLLTQGRSEKGIGSKLFYGAYNLYNALSGYLSDILSYSRLWALGLVTGVMAMTINLISVQFADLFSSMIPFIGGIKAVKLIVSTVILVTIFVLGHIASFLMNLLGAFVHPVRLQFVEFFSKFFKQGTNVFRPFRQQTKYITIK